MTQEYITIPIETFDNLVKLLDEKEKMLWDEISGVYNALEKMNNEIKNKS